MTFSLSSLALNIPSCFCLRTVRQALHGLTSMRRVHTAIAPFAALVLLFSLVTGYAYRFSRNALGRPKAEARIWRDWHVGRFSSLPLSFSTLSPTETTESRSALATDNALPPLNVEPSASPPISLVTSSSLTTPTLDTSSLSSSSSSSLFALSFEAYYPLLASLLICTMIITGFIMSPLIRSLRSRLCCDRNSRLAAAASARARSSRTVETSLPGLSTGSVCSWIVSVTEVALRQWHRTLGLVLALPLLLTSFTGGVWALVRFWFPSLLTKEQLHALMYIHQGSYLGDPLIYTTLLFIGTLPLLFTGVRLVPLMRKWCPPHARTNSTAYTILAVNRAFARSRTQSSGRGGGGGDQRYDVVQTDDVDEWNLGSHSPGYISSSSESDVFDDGGVSDSERISTGHSRM